MESIRALIENNVKQRTPFHLSEIDYVDVRSTMISLCRENRRKLRIAESEFLDQEIMRLDKKYNIVEINETK